MKVGDFATFADPINSTTGSDEWLKQHQGTIVRLAELIPNYVDNKCGWVGVILSKGPLEKLEVGEIIRAYASDFIPVDKTQTPTTVIELGSQSSKGHTMSKITFHAGANTAPDEATATLMIQNGTTYVEVTFRVRRDGDKNILDIKAANCPEEVEVNFEDPKERLLLNLDEKADIGGEDLKFPDPDTELIEQPPTEDDDAEGTMDIRATQNHLDTHGEEETCPAGHPMVIKTNHRNGRQFWGCTKFPNCRNTRPYKQ